MNPVEWLAIALGIILGLYLVVRVCAAAFFKSKSEYERSLNNGTTQHSLGPR